MKAWIRKWLEVPSLSLLSDVRQECCDAIAVRDGEHASIRAADNQRIRDEYRAAIADLKSDHDAAIASLIQEINSLRNSNAAGVVSRPTEPPVKVMRNFRDFRTTVEHRPLERKSK